MRKFTLLFIITFISFFGGSQIVVSYTISPQNPCVGETVTFTSTSTLNGIPVVNYSWDFGDGASDYALNQTTTHIYTGVIINQPVILVINKGTSNPAKLLTPPKINVNANPVAQFTATTSGCILPVSTTIVNQSTTVGCSYAWDFANSTTSTSQNPTPISYATAGTFTPSITVTNTATGCKATASKSVIISSFATDFSIIDSVCIGGTALATDLSAAGVNNWSWTGSNNPNYSIQNPTFNFNVAGTFTVTLTSKNTVTNCISTKSKQIVVVPKPIPALTATPEIGCAPLSVTFTNTTVGGNNFVWTFGDATADFSGKTPLDDHRYTADGFYTVKLICTGVYGCTGTTILPNLIHVTPPIANFMSPEPMGCSPITVSFNNTSTASNALADPISTYSWNLGNGQTSILRTPPDQIYTSGTYDISLTITTQKGCTETKTSVKYVQAGVIDSVRFTSTPASICAKSPVVFTNNTVISEQHNPAEPTYLWEFGDTGTSTDKDPTYTYPLDTGFFDVTLTVTYRGCDSIFKKDSAVFVKAPIADFSPDMTLYCNTPIPVTVTVTDASKKGKLNDDINLTWRWGDQIVQSTSLDNTTLDAANNDGSSTFVYPNYGKYDIWQVIHNVTTGCSDSIKKSIIIDRVDAEFTLNNDSVCKNGLVTMTAIPGTVYIPESTYTYSWGIQGVQSVLGGDTTLTGTGLSDSILHKTEGTFNIILTVTNDNTNCSSTPSAPLSILPINVLELPKASFTPSKNGGCIGEQITFTSTSTHPGTVHSNTFKTYVWTLPNDSLSAGSAVNYTFGSTEDFPLSLVVTDGFGCVSLPSSDPIPFLYPVTKPTPNFTVDQVVCNKTSFSTLNTATGTGALTHTWKLDNSQIISSTSSTLTHTFVEGNSTTSKIHKVTLVTTDANGCYDSLSRNVTISTPKASFVPIFTGAKLNSDGKSATCPPIFGDYNNQSVVFGASYTSSWDFGDGKSSTLKDPKNTFLYAGNYDGKLTITDKYGCAHDTLMPIYLTIGGPSIDLITNETGTICNNLYFFGTLNPILVDRISWDFGDGITATTAQIEHSYPIGGTYSPILTIYDSENCGVDYPLPPITVQNELKAYFVYSPKPGKTDEAVTFDDQSIFSTPILTWDWNFIDFEKDTTYFNTTDANVSYTYMFPYTYQTSLTVTDANGCVSTYIAPIIVKGDFKIANVFTPNGDGLNDTFKFFHDLFKTYDVTILNRWGNLVYEKTGVTGIIIWDGLNQNNEQSTEGVYYFILKGLLIDGTPFEKVGFLTKIN